MVGMFFLAFTFFVLIPMSNEPPQVISISSELLPDNTISVMLIHCVLIQLLSTTSTQSDVDTVCPHTAIVNYFNPECC